MTLPDWDSLTERLKEYGYIALKRAWRDHEGRLSVSLDVGNGQEVTYGNTEDEWHLFNLALSHFAPYFPPCTCKQSRGTK